MPLPQHYHEIAHNPRHRWGIETVWRFESPEAGEHLVLPDGRCDIILTLASSRNQMTELRLAGPSTRFSIVPIKANDAYVGVRLRPGFATAFLEFDVCLLRNRVACADEAVQLAPFLVDLVAPAETPIELQERLQTFVEHRSRLLSLSPGRLSLSLIAAFHASGGRLHVHEVARMHGVSARTVRRLIRAEVGLPPKDFAQVLQFHRAVRLIRDHGLQPAAAAFEAGYSDQAHMTRAFQAHGGFTPARMPEVALATLPI